MIKAGDRVVCMADLGGSGGSDCRGEIGEVAQVYEGSPWSVDFPSQRSYSIGENDLLKVGDTVKVIKSQGFSDHDRLVGKTQTIKAIHSDDLVVSDGSIYFVAVNDRLVGKPNVPLHECFELILGEVPELEVETPMDLGALEELDSLEAQVAPLGQHEILGHKKIQDQLKVAVKLNMPVLLVGDTGTGKTTIVKDLADQHEAQWIRFNLTGETTVDEFVGKYVLKNKETVWEDGILLQAMKSGKWLIVDEINVALPEILFVLHSLLDDERAVLVSSHNGEVVRPHENFRFFGTMNPVDEYAGTKDLNKAFKSRFGMILNMGYPNAKVESKVVAGKGRVSLETGMMIVDVGKKIREEKAKNEVFYTCSTRDLIQWATLSEHLGLKDAFEVTILNKANGDGPKIVKIFSEVTKAYVEEAESGNEFNLEQLVRLNKTLRAKQERFNKEQLKVKEELKAEILDQLLPTGKKTVRKAVRGSGAKSKAKATTKKPTVKKTGVKK